MHLPFRRRPAEDVPLQAQTAEPGWATLPPLLPSASGVELTAPSTSFVRALTGRRAPNLALAPLGHDVRIDAPGGTLLGVARAAESTAVARSPFQFASRRLRRLVQRVAASVTSREAPTESFEAAEDRVWEPEPEPTEAPEDEAGTHLELDDDPLAVGRGRPVEGSPLAAATSQLHQATGRSAAVRPASVSAPAPVPPMRILRVTAPPVQEDRPLLTAPVDLRPPPPTVQMEPETEALAKPEPLGASVEASAPVAATRPLRVVRRVGLGPPVRHDTGATTGRPSVQRREDAPEPEPPVASPAASPAAEAADDTPEPELYRPPSEQRVTPRDPTMPPPVVPVVMRSVPVENGSFVETSDPENETRVEEPAPLVGEIELGAHSSTEVATTTIERSASPATPPPSSQHSVSRELDLEPSARAVESKPATGGIYAGPGSDIVRSRAVSGDASAPPAAAAIPAPAAQRSPEADAPTVSAPRITTMESVADDSGFPDDSGFADNSVTADDQERVSVADVPAESPRGVAPVPARETSPLPSAPPPLPGPAVVARTIEDANAAPVRRVEQPVSRLGAPIAAPRRILGLVTLQRSVEVPAEVDATSAVIVPTRRTDAAEPGAPPMPPVSPQARGDRQTTSQTTPTLQRVAAVDVTMQRNPTLEPPPIPPRVHDGPPENSSRATVGVQRAVAVASARAEPTLRRTTATEVSSRPGVVALTSTPPLAVQRRPDAHSPSLAAPPPPLELASRPIPAAATPANEPGITTFGSAEPVAVQRAASSAPASAAEHIEHVAHAGGGNVAAPSAASGHEAAGGQNLDELAAHLYDRIRARLRDELLIDRERAGLVTDVR